MLYYPAVVVANRFDMRESLGRPPRDFPKSGRRAGHGSLAQTIPEFLSEFCGACGRFVFTTYSRLPSFHFKLSLGPSGLKTILSMRYCAFFFICILFKSKLIRDYSN
jgi:hypothetical protein